MYLHHTLARNAVSVRTPTSSTVFLNLNFNVSSLNHTANAERNASLSILAAGHALVPAVKQEYELAKC